MSKQKQEWMTVKEAHERSGYSTNIIYGLMRRKRVKSRKKNNMYEIEINSLIRDRKKESTASGLQRTREKKQMGEKRELRKKSESGVGREKAEWEREKSEFEALICELRERILTLDDEKEHLAGKLEKQGDDFVAAKKEKETLLEELKTLRADMAEEKEQLGKRIDEQCKKNATMSEECENLRVENAKIRASVVQMEKENYRLHKERQELHKESQARIKDLSESQQNLAGQVGSLNESLQRKESDIHEHKGAIEQLQRGLSGYRMEIHKLQEKLEQHKKNWKMVIFLVLMSIILGIISIYVPFAYARL